MVLELLKYPDERIRLISGNVRFFDDSLQNIITDMVDTMKANGLEALSAIQIGIQYAVVVIKEADAYKPYINLRIITTSGETVETERTPYYENISVDVPRHDKIKIFYENEKGEAQYADLEGAFSRVIQHQLDYNYGSTFVDRVDKETRKRINEYLPKGLVVSSNSSCPTVFYRDYIKRAYKYVMLAVWFSFLPPFFIDDSAVMAKLFLFDKIALGTVPFLIVGYAVYAYYESEKYKQCTSCQTGNIIGTSGFALAQWMVLGVIAFFWMGI
ncbi:peptide deformylase [Sulfurimonas sp. HSL3-7]|uniref:peptide deformylase n=1 Tax=Sulfonitrofixus jiaomeiensis TaxID=3131938 RepID=UPI0031F78F79